MDKDYIHDSQDTTPSTGIVIDKPITINGNGHVIDAKGLSRIFQITSSEVILNNITFVNGAYSGAGAAIYTSGTNTNVLNCNFKDNTASSSGGAIYSTASNLNIVNSSFDNNKATYGSFYYYFGGGAVFASGNNAKITGSNFTNNFINSYGGAVKVSGSNSEMRDCNFINNSGGDGGAVAWEGNNGNLDNCYFSRNKASSLDGGALSWYSNRGTASNSRFENNSALFRGGGVIYQTDYATLKNLTFVGNYASAGGGLFAPSSSTDNNDNYHGVISDSKFINNTARYGGGGADVQAHFKIINSEFINNTANNYGGAVTLSYSELINSTLINNTAIYGGGVYMTNSTIKNITFENNNAANGKTVYIIDNSEIVDCKLDDDEIYRFEDTNDCDVFTDDNHDNLFYTSEGYWAYCSERFVDRPYHGNYDNRLVLLRNAINHQPVGEYLKILIYQFVDRIDDLKTYSFEDYVWMFTDFEYWNSDDPIIKEVLSVYDSGFRVPTENACKVLANGTVMYFNFTSMITPAGQQNLFLFKFDYGGPFNSTLIKQTINKTAIVGEDVEFRILVSIREIQHYMICLLKIKTIQTVYSI